MILLDTNVLGRFTSSVDPQCRVVRKVVPDLIARGERLVIVPQNLYEFWAIATRTRGSPPTGQNGLGLTTKQTSQWLNYFQRRFNLLYDKDDLVSLWLDLVKGLDVTGIRSHDFRLVAAMQSHGITTLLTFNTAHFRNCPITVADPASL
jgi:predicted nucleic acid-binding protein